jgi:hypothetical protein
MAAHFAQLGQLESIGQTELMSRDPLNLRQLLLSRLAHLAPVRNAQFYKGQLLSADRKHLLIIAEPRMSGADTAFLAGHGPHRPDRRGAETEQRVSGSHHADARRHLSGRAG